MIPTGYIVLKSYIDGGVDLDGNPIGTTPMLSQKIRCHVKAVTNGLRIYEGGQYKYAKFIILCNAEDFKDIDIQTIAEVHISENTIDCGTHQIQSIQRTTFTNQIRIIV